MVNHDESPLNIYGQISKEWWSTTGEEWLVVVQLVVEARDQREVESWQWQDGAIDDMIHDLQTSANGLWKLVLLVGYSKEFLDSDCAFGIKGIYHILRIKQGIYEPPSLLVIMGWNMGCTNHMMVWFAHA